MADIEFLQHGFLDTNSEVIFSEEGPEVHVIPFGLETTVSYEGGTSKGPKAIIEASSVGDVEIVSDVLKMGKISVEAKNNAINEARSIGHLELVAMLSEG